MSGHWSRGLPRFDVTRNYPMSMAMTARLRAMHHWIRKGEPDKAYNAARDLFRVLMRYSDQYRDRTETKT